MRAVRGRQQRSALDTQGPMTSSGNHSAARADVRARPIFMQARVLQYFNRNTLSFRHTERRPPRWPPDFSHPHTHTHFKTFPHPLRFFMSWQQHATPLHIGVLIPTSVDSEGTTNNHNAINTIASCCYESNYVLTFPRRLVHMAKLVSYCLQCQNPRRGRVHVF